MTAQGEGILAYLDCVLTEQERTLTPLVGLGTCPDWGHCQTECTHQFGINDSEAKLRRVAAERRLIELHQGVPNHGRYSEPECPADCDGQHDDPPVCMACRDYAGDPLDAPCLTVRFLAEGYGWTEGER